MQRAAKSTRFLEALVGRSEVLILTHDNPDPDAVGSGWALHHLITRKLGTPVRFVAGGGIVRAENRCMLQLLDPPIELLDHVAPSRDAALVFVDCLPGAALHLVENGQPYDVAAVIDHHVPPKQPLTSEFCDLRPKVVAAGTIATQYLREQSVEPSTELATALVYAIQTDARSAAATPCGADKSALSWLVPRADLKKLAEINNAPLQPSYFTDLEAALQNTTLYGSSALCFLPSAHGPEVVGEFADLLIRCECIDQIFCAVVFDGDLFISVRTTRKGGDASALIRRTLAGLGSGGGHQHRAGGKITGPFDTSHVTAGLRTELSRRWLEACGAESADRSKLVPANESRAVEQT